MEIYLVRHAQSKNADHTDYDHEKRTMNPPLTALGVLQAQSLAERLRGIPFDRLVSSDLDRAVQTALPVQAAIGLQAERSAAFREIDMGEVALKGWAAFPEIEERWLSHEHDIAYPGGECGLDVWTRFKQEIDAMARTGAARVVIVTHGGTIRSIICGALKLPQQRRFRLGAPPMNCSISILHWQADGATLHTFNEHAY